jgi:hypothetical protein
MTRLTSVCSAFSAAAGSAAPFLRGTPAIV